MYKTSLQQKFPEDRVIPTLLALSFVFLLLGLVLPAVYLKELIFWKSTFSIVTGIKDLFAEQHYFLAIVIIVFSIIFPLLKLSVMGALWFCKMSEAQLKKCVHWLGLVGKWSMLDVFVVAITIVITKISKFADAQPRIGIYLFCISIVLAIVATQRIDLLLKQGIIRK